jgi:hypothetical protein
VTTRACCATVGGEPHTPACEKVWRADKNFRDPTYGRIDRDIQEAVDEWGPRDIGQRVAVENTLQARREGDAHVYDITPPPSPHLCRYPACQCDVNSPTRLIRPLLRILRWLGLVSLECNESPDPHAM